MCFFETHRQSYTGKVLYSDCYCEIPGMLHDAKGKKYIFEKPFLNQWAAIPIIGILAGITRMVIAIVHVIGHLIAATVTQDKGHLYHAAKGGAEFLRGIIEALPIIGNIFVWIYDPPGKDVRFLRFLVTGGEGYHHSVDEIWNFFAVKVSDPSHPDHIDRARRGY